MKLATLALIAALTPQFAAAAKPAAFVALATPHSLAEAEPNCQESAIDYITSIASAPYLGSGSEVTEKDLELVSRAFEGDGAEAYERYQFRNIQTNEIYALLLYVQEIGGVCPLEKY